jgi:type VI protein secretion system component Hcp
VDPQIGPEVPEFTVTRVARGATYEISVVNSGVDGSRATLTVDGVEIEVYRSGFEGKDQLLAEYRFSDVVLTGLDSYGGFEQISNDVVFDFSGFGQRYLGFDSKTGQSTGETTASWDFGTNTTGGASLLPQSGAQATVGSPEAQMTDASQLDYYVRFEGVNGWLQLDTFQFGGSNSTTLQQGGGVSAGVSKADSAALTLGASAALTGLTGSLLSGQYLDNVEIEVYLSGDKKDILIDEFHFGDVYITGLDSGNAVNNTLTFDYGQISHAHRDIDDKGQPTGFTTSGWDFEQNIAFSGPNPVPDVDLL